MVTKHGDEHHVDVQVTHRDDEPSIAAWLASGDRRPTATELAPVSIPTMPYVSPSAPLLPQGRYQVTVHRELDDDERFAQSLLRMEREVQAVADFLAADFDARMERLLSRSRAFGEHWARCKTASVLQRRRGRVAPLVRELGQLLASEDVAPETAVAIVGLRSRYLSSPEDSQRLPRLTPELLAELDAQRGVTA